MSERAGWKLKRTMQCEKCPWRVGVNPRDIPNGYCEVKHRSLEKTIAHPGDFSIGGHAMACHETNNAHCIGWIANQVGPGNNIGLRMSMISCENAKFIKLRGKQHERFEDTLP